MKNVTVKTSKGIFPLAPSGGGKGYKVNHINECAIGYFLLKEDATREYFTTLNDIRTIRDGYVKTIEDI